jgi:hypothetical protein
MRATNQLGGPHHQQPRLEDMSQGIVGQFLDPFEAAPVVGHTRGGRAVAIGSRHHDVERGIPGRLRTSMA